MAALRRSVREAAARQAELDIVCVIPDGSDAAAAVAAHREVDALISQSSAANLAGWTRIRVECGDPGEVLVRLSADAELLVIGACLHSERRGIFGGGVVPACLTRAVCPVVVCADHGAARSAEAAEPSAVALVP